MEYKEAAGLAIVKAHELFPEAGQITVEEIERKPFHGKAAWWITVGFAARRANPTQNSLVLANIVRPALEYKRMLIDEETGELLAMKMRPVP